MLGKHDSCRRTLVGDHLRGSIQEVILPTRVIDLLGDLRPKLLESNGHKGTFVPLSYCWGTRFGRLDYILTKVNHTEFNDRLPLDRCFKTVLDAFDVAKCLQLRYIWIDALCIVQDDNEDWEREAASMSRIYQTAVLTIAVLGNRDSETGFLDRTGGAAKVYLPWSEKLGAEMKENLSVLGPNSICQSRPTTLKST